MKETAVAQRYARALFLAAGESGPSAPAEVLGQLAQFLKKLGADRAAGALLANPLAAADRKKAALRSVMAAAAPQPSALALNFLDLLVVKKRLDLLPFILAHYDDVMRESQGALKAAVKSAVELDESARRELEKGLSLLFNKKVSIDASVHPDLIGGLLVKAGDTVIDNSIRSQLKNIRALFRS